MQLPWTQLREDKEYVIKKLGLTELEFENLMQLPIKKHTDYPTYTNHYKRMDFYYKMFQPIIKMIRVIVPK